MAYIYFWVATLAGTLPRPDAVALLERVGLADRADDLPARFSRGLRQKSSIALGCPSFITSRTTSPCIAPSDPALGVPSMTKRAPGWRQIRDYIRIVSRRRWIIIGILAIGLLSGVLLNWMTAPTFSASL